MFTDVLGRFIYRFRYGILVFWLVVTCVAAFFLPTLSSIVAHTETSYVPNSSEFVQAQNLLKKVDAKHQSTSSTVVALYNKNGLTSADKSYFQSQLKTLANHKSKYGISTVTDKYNTDSSLSKEFMSKDGTTEIASLGFPEGSLSQKTTSTLQQVKSLFSNAPSGSAVQLTGDVPIEQDNMNISMDGVKKTTVITVVLVLIILLIVFRSVVAPLVTLVSIGLSFWLTQYVVAWLSRYGLPVSTFTQTFLVGVIFGAGTDYSIIIMNRFREELMKDHEDVVTALSAALSAIGKTVLFSGLTVLVSFAILYLAKFGLYRTAVGVYLGVAITLMLCFSLIPAIMAIFGRHLFWPRRPQVGQQHSQSKIWGWTGGAATRHPWLTLLVLVIVLGPTGLLFTNDRTFDPMSDIPQAPSVKGFQTVSKAFSPGKVMPTSIVLHTTKNLRTSSGLATIQKISEALAKAQGVSEVDSATQPTGKEISDFQLASQNGQAASGLGKANSGVSKISSGLKTTANQLKSGQNGMNQLVSGAQQASKGSSQITQGLGTTAASTQKLSQGASQLADGSKQLSSGVQQYTSEVNKVSQNTTALAQGLSAYAKGNSSLVQGAQKLAASIQAMIKANPALKTQLTPLLDAAKSEANGLEQAQSGTMSLSSGSQSANLSLQNLLQGANALQQGVAQLAQNGQTLNQSTQSLAQGATQVSQGTQALSSGLNQLAAASGQLTSGNRQLYSGLNSLNRQFQLLPGGLLSATNGLNSIHSGVSQVQSYLSDSKQAKTTGDPGFYLPAKTVSTNSDLKQSMDAYISPDGHIAKFTVVLKDNPYSNAAMQLIPKLKQTALSALQTAPIHAGKILAAGTTAQQATLNQLSTTDFTRTVVLILSAIFLLLVLMLRSIVTPLYIIMSLGTTYFVTMGIIQQLFVHVFHKPGVSWVVPFFAFLLLVALGVDYSIFLMTRFEEEYRRLHSFPEAMRIAMKNMGNVIFSAALIMAGTFGSMAFSGVTSLVEIGLSVVIGLAVYALVVLAFFVPACATIFNIGHLWPFRSRKDSADDVDAPGDITPV